MVHASDERPQIPEHALDLGCQLKLPLSVDVRLVLHRPPGGDASVDASTVGLQSRPWFDELVEELAGLGLADCLAREDAEGDLRGADLLGHHQGNILEVRFIHLHRPAKNGFQLRQVDPKLP